VILNDFLNTAYKEDETNTPRYVFWSIECFNELQQ
jgi:hypothetical protein